MVPLRVATSSHIMRDYFMDIDVLRMNDWLAFEPNGISTLAISSVPAATHTALGFSSEQQVFAPTISSSNGGRAAPSVDTASTLTTPSRGATTRTLRQT